MKKTMQTLQAGDIFKTNEGGSVTVLNINNTYDVVVRHNDSYKHVTSVTLQSLNNGRVKNPYHPTKYGVGYYGVGPYVASVDGNVTKVYQTWTDMLRRSYCPKHQLDKPTYIRCTVDSRWHNFQVFAKWYIDNPFNNVGYQLDKDIIYPGNTVYSPDTCVLVPPLINYQFRDVTNYLNEKGYPPGVKPSRNGMRYLAFHGSIALGTYDTIDQASHAYLRYRRQYLLDIATQYKDHVDIRVMYTLISTANNLL